MINTAAQDDKVLDLNAANSHNSLGLNVKLQIRSH